jgi:hypothetical protein
MRVTALAILCMILFAGCQATPEAPVLKAYDYTAYDAKGNIVVTGTLQLHQTGGDVTGQWVLEPASGIKFADIGPQSGSGELGGSTRDRTVILNLQPGTIDNHVILRGRFQDRLFSGSWQYVGFGGVVTEGAFAAMAQ